MIKNSELNRLESIAYYAGGKQKDNITVDFDDKNSIFVEVFKTNKFIKSMTLMIVKDLQSR